MARPKKQPETKSDLVIDPDIPIEEVFPPEPKKDLSDGAREIAAAIREVVEASRPKEKKNAFNRHVKTPWFETGQKKSKLKRKMYQHGLIMDEDFLSSEDIDALNKVRPGIYLDGYVTVRRRRDRGIDIDYPVKTASQRMKLVSQFGIRSLKELCERLIAEAENPKKFVPEDELD